MDLRPRPGAAVIIPARLGSRRFPRKVLARDTGKFLIQHVYDGVVGSRGVTRVILATDSAEVVEAAQSFDAEVSMTSSEHLSGTDRVAEVARGIKEGVIINVQGDEPLINRDDVSRLIDVLAADDACGGGSQPVVMATLARRRSDLEGFQDPNIVKVVVDRAGRALYFSRASIAHGQKPEGEWLQHVGVYGFRREFLETFSRLEPGVLEKRERLEQLRALENGHDIQVLLTESEYTGIDTEKDYRAFVEQHRERMKG